MGIQLIFCVETTNRANTDTVYIRDTVSQWYKTDNKVVINIVNLETKTKYKSTNIVRKITELKKGFVTGETRVIYFIDTDRYEHNPDHARELGDIRKYCNDNGCDFVWFCHDVEEVYLGHKVQNNQKVAEASAFRAKKKIKDIKISQLTCDDMRTGTSNIINILGKYLERK